MHLISFYKRGARYSPASTKVSVLDLLNLVENSSSQLPLLLIIQKIIGYVKNIMLDKGNNIWYGINMKTIYKCSLCKYPCESEEQDTCTKEMILGIKPEWEPIELSEKEYEEWLNN